LFRRSPGNPILEPARWPYLVNAVMNPAATVVGTETVLVCRVEDCRGISHLTAARSPNGHTNWVVADRPLLAPDEKVEAEKWGLEDPRVTRVDELDRWVMAYTAYGVGGPSLALATTSDFESVERLGMVMAPEDKNGALLPRRVGDDWVLFHRPVSTMNMRADIWLSRSHDLASWTAPEHVMSARDGGWWDSARIGVGPPPIETSEGWLMVYHGARVTVAGALYRVGLALLDLDDPSRVIARTDEWVLGPRASYELQGDVPGVVFPCGLVHDAATDELRLYYGAADTSVAMATASLTEVLDYVMDARLR
jgi:predicted GH43/DUF377 family glycosyl hydrolase